MDQFGSYSGQHGGISGSNSYQRKELFLDTKGSCFLCLCDPENNGNLTEISEEVCLRNICRYLKINACSILLRSLKGQTVLTEQEKKENESLLLTDRYDFSVMMCSSCSALVQTFSEMITELEHLKMLLREKVAQFNGILSQSKQQDAGRLTSFKDKLRDSCENPVEYRLVENLRQEAFRMSGVKVGSANANSLPKVLLRRLNPVPTTDAAITGSKVQDRASNGASGEIPVMVIGTTEKSKETANLTDTTQVDDKNPALVSDDDEDAMMVELMQSTDDIPEISADPLGPSSPSPLPRPANTSTKTIHTEMSSLAAKKFVSQIFINNFKNSQCDSNGMAYIRYQRVCRICSLECQPQSIRQHLVNDHVQIFFQHKMPRNMSLDKFSEHCKKFLSVESNSAAREMFCGVGPGSKTRALLCPYCNIKCGYEFILRYHLMNEHFHILEEKFVSFLQDNIPGTITKEIVGRKGLTRVVREAQSEKLVETDRVLARVPESNLTIRSIPLPQNANNYSSAQVRKFVAEIFENYFEREEGQDSTKSFYRCWLVCKCCSLSVSGSYAQQHLVKEHVEVLFKHKMSHDLSAEHFSDCCRNFFISETHSAPKVASPKCRKSSICPYCSVRQNDDNTLRFHLVTEHYHILEQKLVILQQSIRPDNALYFAEHGNSDSEDLRPIMTDFCKPVIVDSGHEDQFASTDAMEEDDPQSAAEALIETDALSSVKIITEEPTETIQLSNRFQIEMPFSNVLPIKSHMVQPCWDNFYEKVLGANGRSAYKCLLCPNTNNWGNIRQHLANQHPEKLFVQSRSAYVSEEEFKTQCTELLKRATSNAGREKAELGINNFKSNLFCCSFCNENCYDSFRLRYHVVAEHYAILVDKLADFQKESVELSS